MPIRLTVHVSEEDIVSRSRSTGDDAAVVSTRSPERWIVVFPAGQLPCVLINPEILGFALQWISQSSLDASSLRLLTSPSWKAKGKNVSTFLIRR